jgi:ABC-type uncharacterized transport system permease subunit
VSDNWTFVFWAFLAVIFGWSFVTFANDLFLIFIGDTTGAAEESQGFGRPVVWVVVRSRRIALSGFRKWVYTFMALVFGGAAIALLIAYALAAGLPAPNRALFAAAVVFDLVWLVRRVVRYRRSVRLRASEGT